MPMGKSTSAKQMGSTLNCISTAFTLSTKKFAYLKYSSKPRFKTTESVSQRRLTIRSAERNTEDPLEKAEALYNLGNAYYLKDKAREAYEAYK